MFDMVAAVSLSDILPHSPFRSPAWRSLLAQQPEPRTKLRRTIEDEWVGRARKHLASTTSPANRQDLNCAPQFDRAIQGAIELSHEEQTERRNLLQALLLTAEAIEIVADQAGLPLATVEAYDALFFDVRPHLNARDWVQVRAIGGGVYDNFAGTDPGILWRWAAYTGGMSVLRVVLAITGHLPWPAMKFSSSPKANAEAVLKFKAKAELTIKLMTARTPEQVSAIITLKQRLDKATKRTSSPQETIIAVMEDFLRKAPQRRDQRRHARKGAKGSKSVTESQVLLSSLQAALQTQ
jgi:hypothetical protein